MEVRFNVTGNRRKEMVNTISTALAVCTAEYLGVPSFAYRVGDFTIGEDGTLTFADCTDSKSVEKVLGTLAQVGFACEEVDAPMDSPTEEVQPNTTEAAETRTTETEPMNLSVSLPKNSFTNEALDNLGSLLESKGNLIRKAFGIEEAAYTMENDRITFHWLSGDVTPEGSRAFQDFIGKLCEMARNQKRVTAKPKAYENEKYAFRCFLLRLGLIGNEYKTSRKILLQNLSGNSSWRDGKRKEVCHE